MRPVLRVVQLCAVLLLPAFLSASCGPEALPFDRQAWISVRGDIESDLRERMVDDLLTNHLKAGASRAEIRSLLGKPDAEQGHQILYFVGPGGDFPIDPTTLVLYLGEGGRLVRWEVAPL